jgi:hypothetical protein
MAMKAGAAHTACIAERLNAQAGVLIVPDPPHRAPDATQRTLGLGDLAQQASLRTLQETIEQFPFRHRGKKGNVGRGIQ